jgi:thioredoxin:protein disulfide reductase
MQHTITKKLWMLILLYCTTVDAVEFTTHTDLINSTTQKITVDFNLADNENIIANSLHASVNHPTLTTNKVTTSISAIRKYIPEFQQKKSVYDKNFQASIIVNSENNVHTIDGMVHLSYLSTLNSSILDVQIPVRFASLALYDDGVDFRKSSSMPTSQEPNFEEKHQSWTATLQNLVQTTQSPWAQILFALLLGLLLSLTPCIYPMIPITIGILHSQGRKSLFHDFLGSVSYACGLATTFACLGLLATIAGSSFGSLLSHPPFVIGLVLFIGYMSLTMIGILDMYIPSFMKGEVKLYKNFGPFFASYIFGAISGTVASPCVSPGLALLLSIVATLGNKILGFLLLFAFGIGLSTPLIIIGTFSNSLYLLPKSGMWMVEIKKALGFFMMATCFYYLSNILPIALVYWMMTGFIFFMAMFYLYNAQSHTIYKNMYNGIGIIMISLTIFMGTKSYEKTFYMQASQHHASVDWQTNYRIALDQAQKNNKLLLIDFWANHCTMCKAIDKKVFHNELFCTQTQKFVTFVKIDATHSNNPQYLELREQYKVYAQPTILLIDPATQIVLKKWTTEPYNMKIEDFIEEIINTTK